MHVHVLFALNSLLIKMMWKMYDQNSSKAFTFLRLFIKQGNEVRKIGDEITCESQNIFDDGLPHLGLDPFP